MCRFIYESFFFNDGGAHYWFVLDYLMPGYLPCYNRQASLKIRTNCYLQCGKITTADVPMNRYFLSFLAGLKFIMLIVLFLHSYWIQVFLSNFFPL